MSKFADNCGFWLPEADISHASACDITAFLFPLKTATSGEDPSPCKSTWNVSTSVSTFCFYHHVLHHSRRFYCHSVVTVRMWAVQYTRTTSWLLLLAIGEWRVGQSATWNVGLVTCSMLKGKNI